MNQYQQKISAIWGSLFVASFGYFVDIYDIFIFNVVRVKSLAELMRVDLKLMSAAQLKSTIGPLGDSIHNIFLIGMILGGFFWGLMADVKGRKFVLISTILLYTITTFITGFVQDVETYYWLRFIGGFGLAGELGAGITLVNEMVKKEDRTKVTMIVASVGLLGVVFAGIVGEWVSDWRWGYFIGGGLGMGLFLMRLIKGFEQNVQESDLFENKKVKATFLSNLKLLFGKTERVKKYVLCILVGVTLNFTASQIIGKTNEYAGAFGWDMSQPDLLPKAGWAFSLAYIFISIGDLFFAWLSLQLKSRKKPIYIALIMNFIIVNAFLIIKPQSTNVYYTFCAAMGFTLGFWGNTLANATEQFGTNLRGTVTTTVPNIMRSMTVLLTILFQYLYKEIQLDWLLTAKIVVALSVGTGLMVNYFLKDQFAANLDFEEN